MATPYRPPASSPSRQASTRVRPAEPVQLGVRRRDLAVDPAAGAARVGAAGDDLGEGGVDADLEVPARLAQ